MYTHKNGVTLRKIEESDLGSLKELKLESWYATHTIALVNDFDQREWFMKITKDHRSLFLVAEFQNHLFGVFKVSDIDYTSRIGHIGYDVYKVFRGKGLGYLIAEAGISFCFEMLNLHRCEAEVLENNLASRKVIEKSGFKKEGTKRKSIYKCGTYLDSYVYGILFEEWRDNNPEIVNTTYIPKDDKI